MKNIEELLQELGIKKENVISITGEFSEMARGYKLTHYTAHPSYFKEDEYEVTLVLPNVLWSDGRIFPVESGGWDSCKYNLRIEHRK